MPETTRRGKGRHDGKVLPCEKNSASILVQFTRKEDDEDVDEPVRFTLTPQGGEPRVISNAPRQTIVEHLAPGTWTVKAEFESGRPKYVFDGKVERTFELKKGSFEFAFFKSRQRPWVEVCVLDESTKKPYAGIGVRVKAPDDRVLEALTDDRGVARVEALDLGPHVLVGLVDPPPKEPRADGQTLAPLRLAGGGELAPKAGDTLGSLASAHAGLFTDWKALAAWAFGSDDPRVARRALFERIGCRRLDLAGDDPAQWKFDGNEATRGGTGTLPLPKPWPAEPLQSCARATLHVRRPAPLPGIAFEALDRWFLPGDPAKGGEACRLEYGVEGLAEIADRVSVDVYGSNYSKATVANDGAVTWTKVDVPVHSAPQPPERAHANAGKKHEIKDWRGETSATDGVLKPRAGEKRFLNVAFSPYTVHLRHHKADSDKDARIDLKPFWPVWKNPPGGGPATLDAGSLKIKWSVAKCGALAHGTLVVVDGTDTPVFHRLLKAADLSQGDHEFEWDGKLDDGTDVAAAKMPYRVQLQAHTGTDAKSAVALAAMHTEVRAFVHPDTGKHAAHEAHLDANSLAFSFADFAPKAPDKAADADRWVQYELATKGFHPGAITGNLATDETKRALREFQRSVPAAFAAPYARLAVTESADAATTGALENLPAGLRRPVLARADTFADVALASDEAKDALKDPTKELVVWVDDRHAYTDPGGVALPNAAMGMGNYRGGMDVGDGRTDRDATDVCRPWLPVQVRVPLLSRSQGLDATAGKDGDAVNALVGPLRVDWDFDEPPEDVGSVVGGYDKTKVRTKTAVEAAQAADEETLADGRKRRNARDTLGGIRPADGTKYFKEAFGRADGSLKPWKAVEDDGLQKVRTYVHDDVGQAPEELFEKPRGAAGVFFVPSRIAGDGYRIHARLGLEKSDAETNPFPNREVLEARYPRVPRASSAVLRNWRRTSYRGYLRWAPPAQDKWAANQVPAGGRYEGARLRFVDEPSPSGAGMHHDDVTAFMSQARFTNLVTTYVTSAPWTGHAGSITLHREYVWPYATVVGLGLQPIVTSHDPLDPGKLQRELRDTAIEQLLNQTWRRYRYALLYEVLAGVETTEGRLRGHFMIDFADGPRLEVVEYNCDTCDRAILDFTNNKPNAGVAAFPGARADGSAMPAQWHDANCNAPGPCAGKLKAVRRWLQPLSFPAVGGGLGAAFLFDSGPDVWAHEMGHHRHLEHAQAWPGKANVAPGAKNAQHDSEVNPAVVAPHAKDAAWDLECIMSYNHGAGLAFCGKCVLKMRGWKVEGLANPAGNVHDP